MIATWLKYTIGPKDTYGPVLETRKAFQRSRVEPASRTRYRKNIGRSSKWFIRWKEAGSEAT